MKKTLVILILIILTLIGTFAYKLSKRSTSSEKQSTKQQAQNLKPTTTRESSLPEEKIISKTNLVCRYRPNEKIEITSYLKEDKVFSEIKGENQGFDKFLFFNDTKKIYYWDSKRKQGFTLTASANQPNTQFDFKNTDEYLEQMEKYKPDCRKENISENIFNIPSDVNFQDMDKLQEMMRQNQ